MKKYFWIMSICLGLLFSNGLFAFAEQPTSIIDQLNLTSEQKTQVNTLLDQQKKQTENVKKTLHEKELNYETLLSQPTFNMQEAATLGAEIKNINNMLLDLRLNNLLSLRNILGNDNFKKYCELLKAQKDRSQKEGSGNSKGQRKPPSDMEGGMDGQRMPPPDRM